MLTVPLEEALAALIAKAPRNLTLDQVAQTVGEHATPMQIETFIDRLEAAGIQITLPVAVDNQARLKRVLNGARDLKAAGKKPTPSAIANHLGLPAHEVQATLLYARTLNG